MRKFNIKKEETLQDVAHNTVEMEDLKDAVGTIMEWGNMETVETRIWFEGMEYIVDNVKYYGLEDLERMNEAARAHFEALTKDMDSKRVACVSFTKDGSGFGLYYVGGYEIEIGGPGIDVVVPWGYGELFVSLSQVYNGKWAYGWRRFGEFTSNELIAFAEQEME